MVIEFNLKKKHGPNVYEFSDIWYTVYFGMFRPVKSKFRETIEILILFHVKLLSNYIHVGVKVQNILVNVPIVTTVEREGI